MTVSDGQALPPDAPTRTAGVSGPASRFGHWRARMGRRLADMPGRTARALSRAGTRPGTARLEGRFSGHRLYAVLDTRTPSRAARLFHRCERTFIVLGLAAVVAWTVPELTGSAALRFVLGVALAFFAAEYVLRLIAAPWGPWAYPDRPWTARLHWAASPSGLADALALLPIFAFYGSVNPALLALTSLAWVFKFGRYSESLALLARVLRSAGPWLLSVLLVVLLVLLAAATLAYVVEGERNPEAFGSIPRAFWWAIVTLTTTGYGDVTPATLAGRLLAGVVMVTGIAIFALWAGILANAFAGEMRRRDFLHTWDLVARVPFFADVGAAAIADVARLLKPRQVPAGGTVVRRGRPAEAMYFVVEGEVEVQLKPHHLRLGPGEFFGEMALIDRRPRGSTVVATKPSQLLVLDVADFRMLTVRRPELVAAIREAATKRGGRTGPEATTG